MRSGAQKTKMMMKQELDELVHYTVRHFLPEYIDMQTRRATWLSTGTTLP
jgi:hypothetical protein